MIKFKSQDGTVKFSLKDDGDIKFTDETSKQAFEDAENKVNKVKGKDNKDDK